MDAVRVCWDEVREPAAYVREVLGHEAPTGTEAGGRLREVPRALRLLGVHSASVLAQVRDGR